MKNKEKILRWDLQQAIKELNENVGEVPIVQLAFAIKQHRQRKVDECKKLLSEYLKKRNESIK